MSIKIIHKIAFDKYMVPEKNNICHETLASRHKPVKPDWWYVIGYCATNNVARRQWLIEVRRHNGDEVSNKSVTIKMDAKVLSTEATT